MKEISADQPWRPAPVVVPESIRGRTQRRVGVSVPEWLRGLAGGMGALLLAIAILEAVERVVSTSPAVPALLVAVVVAVLLGGTSVGVIVSLTSIIFLADHLSDSASNHLSYSARLQLFEYAPAAIALALLVGLVQLRTERRYQLAASREREHTERMAALERVKAQFLNLASHELRGPLSVVRGYVSMVEDGSFGPPASADMTKAAPVLSAKVSEMSLLVDKMLDTARLEEHRLTLQLDRVDLRTIAQQAVDAVTPLSSARHQVLWTPPRAPAPVRGDPVRLGIVVTNLMHNAIKYSPAGGVVQCFVTTTEDQALLTVWDQGLGIAEDDLPRLFSRFGRLVTRENSHIPGTGLGLYLARELARLHGGDIVVRSEAGRGSVFTLSLPLDRSR